MRFLNTDTGEFEELEFKTPYNHDTNAESDRCAFVPDGTPSLTQQHLAHDADINTIWEKFTRSGEIPVIKAPPTYENFGDTFDFQSAMNAIKAAQDSFDALPAKVRESFNNNPANFLGYVDACVQAGDLKQLKEWGLALPDVPAEPTEAKTGGGPAPDPSAAKPA